MKLREVGTIPAALKDSIDILGVEAVAAILGCSAAHAYRLSDPDYEGQALSFEKASDLDVACRKESGKAPFKTLLERKHSYYGTGPDAPQDLETALLSTNAAIGQLNASILEARRPGSESGYRLSRNERAAIMKVANQIHEQLSGIHAALKEE